MAIVASTRELFGKLERLTPLGELGVRLYLAWVFWKAGQAKLANWDSTVFLFEYEYAVPLLPHEFAAQLATAIEIGMPVLLTLGGPPGD